MGKHPALINRAIAMHLLREGHFDVARVFMDEARDMPSVELISTAASKAGVNGSSSGSKYGHRADLEDDVDVEDTDMANGDSDFAGHTISNFTQIESLYLQEKFQNMYAILQSIKAHDLEPGIQWARDHSEALEERGSNLEFELCKLQFIWLAKAGRENDDGEDEGGEKDGAAITGDLAAAFQYARDNFDRFHGRHLSDIERLAAALVFASNIRDSPYATVFETRAAFDDVASSFTREFCSLLGLSAESPLYVAATAGIIALPRLIKFIGATRSKRTEWTTDNEMAFETPLPASMTYHSIFVCPVSKEQTTEANPPMRLPCGHVLASDSLRKLAKGNKFKCPYCPAEGQLREARQIIL